MLNINHAFAQYHYARFLQKRFGINSCSASVDYVVLSNQKSLLDLTSYVDISSSLISDTTLHHTCSKKPKIVPMSAQNCQPLSGNMVKKLTFKIEVNVGSPTAITYGITAGVTEVTNLLFKDVGVDIVRAGVPLAGTDLGGDYFTKVKSSTKITFATPLEQGEALIIKTIPY